MLNDGSSSSFRGNSSSSATQASPASFHIRVLKNELEARRARNPRYSLRAFSKWLEMDPAALSRIFNGKQDLSPKACSRILNKLALPDPDRELFLASVLAERNAQTHQKISRDFPENSNARGPLVRALYDKLVDHYHDTIAKKETSEFEEGFYPQGFRSVFVDSTKLESVEKRIDEFLKNLEQEHASHNGLATTRISFRFDRS
jgi:hypothetical protein